MKAKGDIMIPIVENRGYFLVRNRDSVMVSPREVPYASIPIDSSIRDTVLRGITKFSLRDIPDSIGNGLMKYLPKASKDTLQKWMDSQYQQDLHDMHKEDNEDSTCPECGANLDDQGRCPHCDPEYGIVEATNCGSIGGGHVGSIDIIGSIPVHPDLNLDLDLDKIYDEDR